MCKAFGTDFFDSPVSNSLTWLYVRRALERIRPSKKVERVTLPSALTRISQTMQSRSTFGFSEHRPFDSTSGSIGTTRSGKYTDVPRRYGFLVQRCAHLHVVGNVGDRHEQSPAISGALAVDGIIEIPGVCAINRNEVYVSEVCSTLLCLRRNFVAVFLDLIENRLGPLVRNCVGLNRNVRRNALVARRTDYVNDAPGRLLDMSRVVEYLGHDYLAGFCLSPFVLGNQDAVRNPGIVGNNEPYASLADELSRHLARTSVQHIDELAFGTPASIDTDNSYCDAVSIEQRAHFAGRQIDIIGLTVISNDEAEPVTVPTDRAGDEVELDGQAKFAAPVLENLPGPYHRIEASSNSDRIRCPLSSKRHFSIASAFRGYSSVRNL